jgi:hypothetical protein
MGFHDPRLKEAPRGYYPGSRVPLPSGKETKPTKEVTPQTWDSRPVWKVISSVKTEFFTIGAVCAALGRPPVTIRLWVKHGHIPDATFRLPDKSGIRGRRLYTRKQVEAIIQTAEDHGILGSTRVNWTQHQTFAADVRKAWALIG